MINLIASSNFSFMDKQKQQTIIQDIRAGYDNIASNYARTRAILSTDLRDALDMVSLSGKVLDAGCANARFYDYVTQKGGQYFGIDGSEKFCQMAKSAYPQAQVICGNVLEMPYENNFFDCVISSSVLHHIPGRDLQKKFLLEHKRVLKPHGQMLLRVWDLKQNNKARNRIFISNLKKFFGLSNLEYNDIIFPWKDQDGGVAMQRYFHCFGQNELIALSGEAGFKVVKTWRDGKGDNFMNIYLILEK